MPIARQTMPERDTDNSTDSTITMRASDINTMRYARRVESQTIRARHDRGPSAISRPTIDIRYPAPSGMLISIQPA